MQTTGQSHVSTVGKERTRFFSTLGAWCPKYSNALSKPLKR